MFVYITYPTDVFSLSTRAHCSSSSSCRKRPSAQLSTTHPHNKFSGVVLIIKFIVLSLPLDIAGKIPAVDQRRMCVRQNSMVCLLRMNFELVAQVTHFYSVLSYSMVADSLFQAKINSIAGPTLRDGIRRAVVTERVTLNVSVTLVVGAVYATVTRRLFAFLFRDK